MAGTYKCEHCQQEFTENHSDAAAEAEFRQLFDVDTGDPVRICHPCWVDLMTDAEKRGLVDDRWRKFA